MIESKLEAILLKHLKLLKELLQSAHEKKDSIVKNRAVDLDKMLEKEGYVMAQINELEISRMSLFKEADLDGKNLANAKVIDAIDCFQNGDIKIRLKKIQKAITQTMVELKKVNELNRELLSFAINNLNEFFDTLFQSKNPPNVYTAKGKKNIEQVKRNIFLDKQA